MMNHKGVYKNVWPYQQDNMKLPVHDLEAALPFYLNVMGFQLISRNENPYVSAVLGRDHVQIGLNENGGDPAQDGCFFEVEDVQAAYQELQINGLRNEKADYTTQKDGDTSWKVFFVVAPDGLCYCIGQRQQ